MSKPERIFFYYGVLPALIFQLIGSLFYFVVLAGDPLARIIYTATKVVILIWPLIWVFGLKASLPRLEGEPTRKTSLVCGLGSGIAIAASVLLVYFLMGDTFTELGPAVREKSETMGILKHYLLFSAFLSLSHSFLEEYYWRWFVFRGLLVKFRVLPAAIISSVAFGSHHFVVLSQFFEPLYTFLFGIGVIIGGLLWCWVYHRTRSLLGGWVSHILADAAILYVGYLLLAGS